MRLTCFAALRFGFAVIAFSAAPAALATANQRREIPLREGWQFRFESPADAPASIAAWNPVAVPHTWNAGDATSRDYRRGRGWYRLHFAAPQTDSGERVYVQFDAVTLVATVWLNGQNVGSHVGGFSRFRFDITDRLRTDRQNVLMVCADSSARDDVPPRSGDFTVYGGICRPVSLLITPAVAIEPLDHGGPGVYLTTPEITAEAGRVSARVLVRNSRPSDRTAEVAVVVRDDVGREVARQSARHRAMSGESTVELELSVPRPRRWAGRRDPYVYRAEVTLTADGTADSVVQPLGFRTFRIDNEKGFILNGEPYDLHGVNVHQEFGGKGWAAAAADEEADLRLIAELGCTFVRFAHYQHPEHGYEVADRLGLAVWTENPLVNTVSDSPAFAENCARSLRELIRQNFNHPSVMCWGIGNEVQTNTTVAKPLLELLAREVRLEDPARLSTLATNYGEPAGAYGVDGLAHNKYYGWYQDEPQVFAAWLLAQRAETQGKAFGISEYGAGAGASIHSAAPVRLDHSEEYQAMFHEAYWRILRNQPWVWCKIVWVMFDFPSASRDEGERPGINDKGLVTRDRQTRKDAFYWYQAQWTAAPMVHIASRRFTPRKTPETAIKVYSNCDTVELFLNGRSRGVRPVEDRIARWADIALNVGENQIEVVARRGAEERRDTCAWTFEPNR